MQSPDSRNSGFDIQNPPMQGGNNVPAGQQMQQATQLTKEESAVLKECQSEAYWYRSLPLGIALGAAGGYMVKAGILAPHARFGAGPKAMIGIGLGYFIGKGSYVGTCKDKIVEKIPNSNIGRMVRKQRGEIVPDQEQDAGNQMYSAPNAGFIQDNTTNLMGMGKRDTDMANTGGDSAYSDYFSGNNPQGADKSLDERRLGAMTYDQLRAEHRHKEMEKPHMQQGALIRPSTPVDPTKVNTPPATYSPQPPAPSPESNNMYSGLQSYSQQPSEFDAPTSSRKRTNKYGDEGFE